MMENLPNELLSQILGFLHPVYDVLVKFSPVCQRWNEIIHKTPCLWEHFHLKNLKLTKKEKDIVFKCLREFNGFIKCLRVPLLDFVFGNDYEFFIRIVTLEMTNITCLDVPTFPWNLQQFVALKSAENLRKLNLYCFWDLSNIEWTHSYSQPVSLINQGHLQLLKVRCSKLEALKLSMNMLRVPGKVLMDFLNTLKLKDLQISAYNSSEANIQMNQNGLKLLKCLLSSRYVSVVSRLDLHYVSLGHKELRLLLKVLKSLRYLTLRFLEIYRCMTGYQYLESKSLEYFELENLPAKNISNLKCWMPKLRDFSLTGCATLRSLQVLSSMLHKIFLNRLPYLRSLHVTTTTLKVLDVGYCESLTADTLDKVLKSNGNVEKWTVRGHLSNFKFFRTDTNCVLTNLRLWMTDICNVQYIEVHCPTLKSFMCNHHDPDGEFPFALQEASIDLRCNDFVDVFIALPRISSINIKCNTLMHFLLNVGEQKTHTRCTIIRIEASKKLKTFGVHKGILNRVEINAEKIDNLDFSKCRIKGVLKVKAGYVEVISMRTLLESQGNVDLIARCREVRKLILRDCSSLHTFTVFFDEMELFKSSLMASTNPYRAKKPQSEDTCSNLKALVKEVCVSNCPCFSGIQISSTINYEISALSDKSSSRDLSLPGTNADVENVNLVFRREEDLEGPKNESCLGSRLNAKSLWLDAREQGREIVYEHCITDVENSHCCSPEKVEQIDRSHVCARPLPLATQNADEGRSGHVTDSNFTPDEEQYKDASKSYSGALEPSVDSTQKSSLNEPKDCTDNI